MARQEDCKFEVILGYTVRHVLKNKQTNKSIEHIKLLGGLLILIEFLHNGCDPYFPGLRLTLLQTADFFPALESSGYSGSALP